MLKSFKDINEDGLNALKERMVSFYASSTDEYCTWNVISKLTPVYLLGRYRKLSRDVPQSPWETDTKDHKPAAKLPHLIEASASIEDTSVLNSSGPVLVSESLLGKRRKGRNSVEEIIVSAVRDAVGTDRIKMHSCGREDIDVRMLGMHTCMRVLYVCMYSMHVCNNVCTE